MIVQRRRKNLMLINKKETTEETKPSNIYVAGYDSDDTIEKRDNRITKVISTDIAMISLR